MTISTATTTKAKVVSNPVTLADDDRGVIEQLSREGYDSVLRITSKAGTVRANHYHKKDSHMCYVIKGTIRYVEQDLLPDGSFDLSSPLREYIVEQGQCFYTAPMIAHAMEFVVDTEFLAISPRTGDSKEYETDLIRVELINPAEAAARAAA
jgi:dTDP-4-dehydrorhamnose 3,5-epimerase-like enzyme